jgi:uncharacterized heparinase superfamily protein
LFRKILRLYHTVKYLKAKQIFWRVYNFFPRIISEVDRYPKFIDSKSNNIFISKYRITDNFEKFTFLNETYSLNEVGWDNKSISKLWRYNLHYFDYLIEVDRANNQINNQLILIENWIKNNPFGKGTAWEPYPTSLRIINWIKWHWQSGGRLSENAKVSLWNQVRWLENRLEYHLLGNHLFINAKALLFASAFFDLEINSNFYRKSISILKEELDEQFLDDGAHFELSPMYHSLAMEDLLDLINISNKLPNNFPTQEIQEKFYKGMYWLQTMTYKNDELSHFNDCANGIAPLYSNLVIYADKLGITTKKINNDFFSFHKNSGFVVVKNDKWHLIADFGKIGPDYLPGHAHADTLSFELAFNGERIVVNSGTSLYGKSAERLLERGTGAHSTIQIDMHNSSDIWSGFRVARRAVPFNILVNSKDESYDKISFQASHNGYSRLKSKPIHTRKFNLFKNTLSVCDIISGNRNTIVSRFYLHPKVVAKKKDKGIILSKNNIDLILLKYDCKLNLNIVDSYYHDYFGVSKSNKCIEIIGMTPCKLTVDIEIL